MKTDKTSTLNEIDPNKNVVTLFDTDILVEVANGRLDLNEVVLNELRNRGLDNNGKWVGFNLK